MGDLSWATIVDAVERAYVARAVAAPRAPAAAPGPDLRAAAALGAVASRYLAVGTPRSLAVIATVDDAAAAVASIEAHGVWFKPRELRCAVPDGDAAALAAATGARAVSLAEALASDIVCVHARLHVTAHQLRRGTHVNVLGPGTIDGELAALAMVVDELVGPTILAELAAGLKDGRQLDELTVFRIADAGPAIAAIAAIAG
jgi:hypothetical protein